MKNNNKFNRNQKGAALVVGLALLLVLTIIGVTSMKSALLQEKMSSSLKNRELADSAAMSMLTEVERYLFNYYSIGNNTELDSGSSIVISPRSTESYAFRNTRDMTNGYSNLSGVSINDKFGGILHDEPRFIIEYLGESLATEDGTASLGTTGGEADGGSGDAGASDGSDTLRLYRIVTKANDPKGTIYSMFESVMSIRIK